MGMHDKFSGVYTNDYDHQALLRQYPDIVRHFDRTTYLGLAVASVFTIASLCVHKYTGHSKAELSTPTHPAAVQESPAPRPPKGQWQP